MTPSTLEIALPASPFEALGLDSLTAVDLILGTPHSTDSNFRNVRGPWVVVPTYNEIDNLETIVGRLITVLRAELSGPFSLLVVDDNSPDGTGDLADRLASEIGEVQVLHRKSKDGLGQAYIAGFGIALEHGATYVVQMDADLSHEPEAVPSLIEAARGGALAIGSRYVDGGSTPDWKRSRRIISRLGSLYSRRVLSLRIRDLTGGFKCFPSHVLKEIDLSTLRSQGYVFQVELTYRAVQAGVQVTEVPITFRDRQHGNSKMSSGVVGEALARVPQLRFTVKKRSDGLQPVPQLAPAH